MVRQQINIFVEQTAGVQGIPILRQRVVAHAVWLQATFHGVITVGPSLTSRFRARRDPGTIAM